MDCFHHAQTGRAQTDHFAVGKGVWDDPPQIVD